MNLIPPPTEQDRIMEQVDLDPWLSRQEAILGRAPDGNLLLRVYLDDLRTVPFGLVRNVGCQIIYESNDPFRTLKELAEGPPTREFDSGFTCEQRGLKER